MSLGRIRSGVRVLRLFTRGAKWRIFGATPRSVCSLQAARAPARRHPPPQPYYHLGQLLLEYLINHRLITRTSPDPTDKELFKTRLVLVGFGSSLVAFGYQVPKKGKKTSYFRRPPGRFHPHSHRDS